MALEMVGAGIVTGTLFYLVRNIICNKHRFDRTILTYIVSLLPVEFILFSISNFRNFK